MPASRTHLYGWSPTDGSDDQDVDLPTIQTTINNNEIDSPPARDGAWVARPRNRFIIFRCEFSKEHSKDTTASHHEPHSDKTLSKRAAEAWQNLPESEKNRFKQLADIEKEEHARLNPNYRFRPLKRQGERKRKIRRPSIVGLKRSVGRSSPEAAPTSPISDSTSIRFRPTTKAERRRSSSVPSLIYSPEGHLLSSIPDPSSIFASRTMRAGSNLREEEHYPQGLLTRHSNATSMSLPALSSIASPDYSYSPYTMNTVVQVSHTAALRTIPSNNQNRSTEIRNIPEIL